MHKHVLTHRQQRLRSSQGIAAACFFVVVLIASVGMAQSRQAIEQARNRMVDEEIVAAGVQDARVIRSMRTTPRHEFVPFQLRRYAYYDMAMPIGYGQTISPPFVVAYMTEQLDPQPTDKVLEIGTGSGYQAAVLSPLARDVYTIEIVEPLGRRAERALRQLRYKNVHCKVGDGFLGWPEHAPFDKIIVTCSPEDIPRPLVEQLVEGGRMVIPVGERYRQNLYLLRKIDGQLVQEALRPTLFVPMTGQAEADRDVLPDPANPRLHNGDFEEAVEETGRPSGWHYGRQFELVSDGDAPSGQTYVKFTNSDPGRGCRLLQGIPVDGRLVKQLKVTLTLRGKDLRPGQDSSQVPLLVVTFFDEDRARLGERLMGPWQGTFDWRTETSYLAVPSRAREAIVRIGLLRAVGELSVDNLQLERK